MILFIVPLTLALGWGLAIGVTLTIIFFPPLIAIADDLRALPKKSFKNVFLFFLSLFKNKKKKDKLTFFIKR